MADASCPNCGEHLEKVPKRKSKCPHCGQLILVRDKTLVSEDRAQEIDAIKMLQPYEILEKDFVKTRNVLSKRFGTHASVADTTWAIYNELVSKKVKNSEFGTLSQIYSDMARQLVQENKKGYKELLVNSQKMQLYEIKKSGIYKKVKFYNVNDGHVCPECRDFEGKEFTVDEIIANSNFPANFCQSNAINDHSGFCRCWVVPIFDADDFESNLLNELQDLE